MIVARALSLVAAALFLHGCATPPAPPEAPAPASAVVAPDAIVARDDAFVVVRTHAGETYATLAQQHLGSADKASWIAEVNGAGEPKPGDVVAIPRHAPHPLGVQAGGYQSVPVLCYHRFGTRVSKLTVSPAAFDAQMQFLARNGYEVITLARLARFLDGKETLPPKSVVITIDDGYRATYDIAYPILKKYGFPATVFLYSDFVGASDALTWPQMKEMEASGLVEIQPHSKTHSNLTLRLPDETEARYRDRIRREVEVPVEAIRGRLDSASRTYAYPYGDVNDIVVDELTRRNIQLGLTVTPGGNGFYAYPYLLRRNMIFGNEDLEAFRAKLVTFVRTAAR